jgi:hypothetical protein
MDNARFQEVLDDQMDKNRTVLSGKALEYASDIDRLSNFKKAAHLNGETQVQALWGMLSKHLVSLSDMVETGNEYPMAVWEEKIGDALNYLYLLKAVVVEEEDEKPQAYHQTINALSNFGRALNLDRRSAASTDQQG